MEIREPAISAQHPASLTPGAIAQVLRSTAVMLQAELPALPEAALAWHPAPGEWCIKEALGHLIEAEQRGFAGRIRAMLAAESPRLTTWDRAAVARERDDCAGSLAELLRQFGEVRAESVVLVSNLSESALLRGGDHPEVGRLRISDVLHEWVYHDRAHLQQMQSRVQAFVWPHMGNARRFSGA